MDFELKEIEKTLPKISRFEERDIALMTDVLAVFKKHGLTGRVKALEFECGTPGPRPKVEFNCYRYCIPGPDGRPICTWVCT